MNSIYYTRHIVRLSGLLPFTTYQFRAISGNVLGREASEIRRFSTGLMFLPSLSNTRRTVALWDRLAPASYRGLLSASPATLLTAPAGRFWWDPQNAQFGFGTRGLIPATAIRSVINDFNQSHGEALGQMAVEAAEERLALPAWRQQMEQAIQDAHLANAAAGRGGVEALTDDDLRQVESAIAEHLARFRRFLADMARGMTARAAGWRAAAYAKSAITSFHVMRRRAADVAGFTLERNVLGAAEHCFWNHPTLPQPRPDCPSLTDKGWVVLGQMPPIGTRLCLWNCKCHVVFGR